MPRAIGRRRLPEVGAARHQAADLVGEDLALLLLLEVGHDLGNGEHADRHDDEADAVEQLRHAEGEALRSGVHVDADEPQDQPDDHHADGLQRRAVGDHHRPDQAQHHEGEILGRAETGGSLSQGRRQQGADQRRHGAGHERGDGRDRQRRPRPPLPRHLVAVEASHDRGGLAGQVDQDCRRRAAVLGAVVDAGQHDQRRGRRQRVGDRQQHGDGGDRADARQHADQRAEQHADEAVEQVVQGRRGGETEREIAEQVPSGHGFSLAVRRPGTTARPAWSD